MTSKVGKRPLRSLSAHEKMEAIRRVHDGESKASVARDIGVPESTLRGWCKNEDKILYLSRQSTPDTDDSDHLQQPREKKQRFDAVEAVGTTLQPYNLSVRGASNSPPPQPQPQPQPSTASETIDSTAENDLQQLPAALNLTNKQDSPKTSNIVTPTSTVSASDRERERNRAELTRLSIELGLNRPEMFLPSSANIAANLSDLSASLTANLGLVAQWNNALLQQVTANAVNTKKRSSTSANLDSVQSQHQVQPVVSTTMPIVTSAPTVTTHHHSHHNNNHISNNNNNNKTSHKSKKSQLPADGSLDDSVWYWLKTQQAMLGLVQNSTHNQNNVVDPNSSWFWKWYKQLAYSQQLQPQTQIPQHQQQSTPEKPILYQQLTKDSNSENLKIDDTPKSTKQSSTKVRAVLDNLLLNNNNNNDDSSSVVPDNGMDGNTDVTKEPEKNDDSFMPTPASAAEALCHGEMFLKWLEKCGDPSVTAVQILQFRYLLNNIRTGADRRNGTENHKTKIRSRK